MSGGGPVPDNAREPQPLAVRIPDACRMIGIGRSKLYELIADGTIQIVKIGSITVIPVSQIRALIEKK